MRVLVGDDTGLLKGVEVSEVSTISSGGSTQAASITHRWGRQGPDERVTRMCWAGADAAARHAEFASALSGGRLELRHTDSTELLMSWQGPAAVDPVRGLAVSGAAEHDWRLVSCTETGVVRTWRRADAADAVDGETAGWDAEWATCGLSGKPLGDANSVSRMRVDRVCCGRLALGGREKELAVWDIATQTAIFNARNVGHDMLNLRQGVWNTDLDFCTGSENELIAVTASREIRHYDMRIGKGNKPLYSIPVDGVKMDVGDCRLNAMALLGDHLAICGDVVGGLTMFDLRTRNSVGAMAGGGGAVREIAVDESRGMVAACGADRYVRVYKLKRGGKSGDVQQKKMIHKVYLKQRTNSVLIEPAAGSKLAAAPEPVENSGQRAKFAAKKGKKKSKKLVTTTEELDPLAAMEAAFGLDGDAPAADESSEESEEDADSEEGAEHQDLCAPTFSPKIFC